MERGPGCTRYWLRLQGISVLGEISVRDSLAATLTARCAHAKVTAGAQEFSIPRQQGALHGSFFLQREECDMAGHKGREASRLHRGAEH